MMTRRMAIVNSPSITHYGCMETLGELLRNYRKRAGDISQVEMARRTGIPQGTISRIETGAYKEVPPPNVLIALADEMGVSEIQLLRSLGYLQGMAAVVEPDTIALFEPVEREILEGLPLLSDRELSHVLAVLDFLDGGNHGANTARQPVTPRTAPGADAGHRRTG